MDNKIIKDLEVELRNEPKTTKEVIRTYTKKQRLISLLGGKCSKCGETAHHKLEFHHTRDKEFDIGHSKSKRISELEKELEKCELLCCNCHAKEHHDSVVGNTLTRKRKQLCLDYKNSCGCSICGYNECIRALDFHHNNPLTKLFCINPIICAIKPGITKNIISQSVKDELDKCIVVCKNCHKDIHFNNSLYEKYKELILFRIDKIKEIQSPLDKNEVKQLFESGMKPIDIAKKYNASKGTISGILKSFGLSRSSENISKKKQDNENLIIKLHNDGKFLDEIIDVTNFKQNYIRKVLKIIGETPKQKTITREIVNNKETKIFISQRKFNPSKEELGELLKTNSLRQIGKLYGVSQVAVLKRKRLLGL